MALPMLPYCHVFLAIVGLARSLYGDPLVRRFNGVLSGFSRGERRDIGEGAKAA